MKDLSKRTKSMDLGNIRITMRNILALLTCKHCVFISKNLNRNIYHGNGTLIDKDQNIFEGEFKEGVRTGIGKMQFANGDVYTGEYLNGKFHGKSTRRHITLNRFLGTTNLQKQGFLFRRF